MLKYMKTKEEFSTYKSRQSAYYIPDIMQIKQIRVFRSKTEPTDRHQSLFP